MTIIPPRKVNLMALEIRLIKTYFKRFSSFVICWFIHFCLSLRVRYMPLELAGIWKR